MWRSGDFVKSMFYSALKIKRLEVASVTYFRHASQVPESQDLSAVEKARVRLRTVSRLLGWECSQETTDNKGDIDDQD
jgi:hypothetical protein